MECASKPHVKLPACSFKASLHPHYEAIKAECEPWIESFTASASQAASQSWRGCAFPLLCSLAYADCATERVVLLVKLFTWFFVSDSDDDHPLVLGCEPDLVAQRHALMLACYAQNLDAVAAADIHNGTLQVSGSKYCAHKTCAAATEPASIDIVNMHKITEGLDMLHHIWKDICKDMSLQMQARYLKATRDHLNGNMLQAYYRKVGRLPGVEEYANGLRRPTSLLTVCFIFMEYGLGMELDDEMLGSEVMIRLQDAVTDHVALVNDVFSCEVEKCIGDYFNLPCVILQERISAQPGFTFADAMCEALSMIEEVDKVCVQLMEEVENSKGIEKPGVRAYLRGLKLWMAGNLHWSLKTARYSHHPFQKKVHD